MTSSKNMVIIGVKNGVSDYVSGVVIPVWWGDEHFKWVKRE
jgi:hypothetical protein